MNNDHEIGRVVAVDTAEVTVELTEGLKMLSRSTYEGPIEVGQINSYIVVPVGLCQIVAIVTRIVLALENDGKTEKGTVVLPSSKRFLTATMVGTIDEEGFRQGISLFPVLDSPVCIATKRELDAIFGQQAKYANEGSDTSGFRIAIGKSAVFPDYDIRIDPDAFFGKHAAIIGSTGSGKSCTIAAIIAAC